MAVLVPILTNKQTMKEKMKLKGKVALITGASRGIGQAVAEHLAAEGAALALHCHLLDREEKLFLRRLEKKYGVKAKFYEAVFPDLKGIRAMVEQVGKDFGRIDILVNNAGVYPETKFFSATEASWDRVMGVNLKSNFFISQMVAKMMIKKGGGNILNIASVAGMYPRTSSLEYAVSKAGMIHLTKSLAHLLAPKIRVNAIAPSYTWTSFMSFMKNKSEVRRRMQAIPFKSFNMPDDVARAALFLVTADSRYVTGEVMVIDGGRGGAVF